MKKEKIRKGELYELTETSDRQMMCNKRGEEIAR